MTSKPIFGPYNEMTDVGQKNARKFFIVPAEDLDAMKHLIMSCAELATEQDTKIKNLQGVLAAAANQFRLYEKAHHEKEPPAPAKAIANRNFALMCEGAAGIGFRVLKKPCSHIGGEGGTCDLCGAKI